MNWKHILLSNPSFADINNWPVVDMRSLSKKQRKIFLRNLSIIKDLLANNTSGQVASTYGISTSFISKLLKRCLSPNEDGELPLTTALIPYTRLKKYTRVKANCNSFLTSGFSGDFQRLLSEHPLLLTELDDMLIAWLNREPYAELVTPTSFHNRFIHILKNRLNLSHNDYPLNTQTAAYETLRKYLRGRELELSYQKESKTMHVHSFVNAHGKFAFDEIQIDEQCADAFASFHFYLSDRLVSLKLSRVSVIFAKDYATQCMLGYVIALNKTANQEDILALFEHVLSPWKKMKLTTPGLEYCPGAKFPSAVNFMKADSITFGMVKLDNAMSHHANSVKNYLIDDLGCIVNYGLPAQPTHRAMIEQAIKLANKITHSFESTTGSHIRDPKRSQSKNTNELPVLTLRAFEETLDVVLTQYNVTPCAVLGGATPLETLEKQVRTAPTNVTPLPHNLMRSPFIDSQICVVHYEKNGGNRAYINALSVKYRGACLLASPALKKQVEIRYDRRDVRTVKAYDQNGKFLGELTAPYSWQIFKHSLKARQAILKLIRKQKFSAKKPLVGVFDYLLEHKKLPEKALSLAKVLSQSGLLVSTESQDVNVSKEAAKQNKSNVVEHRRSNKQNTQCQTPANDELPLTWSTTWTKRHE